MKAAPRPYAQTKRAEDAEATLRRIRAAATELFVASGEAPTLAAVAERADVAVQTVLRRFGSKEGLFAACLAAGASEVAAERGAVTPGDIDGAVGNLLAHYDAWGERSLRLLALESTSDAARTAVAEGRRVHRAWVEHAFGPGLARLDAASRKVARAQLVAVTDVWTWKLLSDEALGRAALRRALTGLVRAALSPPRSPR